MTKYTFNEKHNHMNEECWKCPDHSIHGKELSKVLCHKQSRLETWKGYRTIYQGMGHGGISQGTEAGRVKASLPENA